MSEPRVVWPMANWWARAAMLAFAAFFAWVIFGGLGSTDGNVYLYTIIPSYGLFLYATIASLVHRRSVIATPEGLLVTNGPFRSGT